ncbi:MAG: hypothetical protein N2647_02265 [Thermodesulfovibrio sp.]|nr:hypothetical protein [Thermodesulfovibrio sp.]
MKAKLDLEFRDIPVEKIQNTLIEILHALKAMGMIEDGKFEIHTPNGIITEKCILQESRVIG